MDARLSCLIADYVRTVGDAVVLLARAGIPRPTSNFEWERRDLKNGEFLSECRMFKHGFGCSVRGPGVTVDFDFGMAGQIDRFDIGRLQAFATRDPNLYGFSRTDEIRSAFQVATAVGELGSNEDGLSFVAAG
jgi:hypothetical protein